MKKTLIYILLLTALILAACTPAATPAATFSRRSAAPPHFRSTAAARPLQPTPPPASRPNAIPKLTMRRFDSPHPLRRARGPWPGWALRPGPLVRPDRFLGDHLENTSSTSQCAGLNATCIW